jgi:hypothetical protein
MRGTCLTTVRLTSDCSVTGNSKRMDQLIGQHASLLMSSLPSPIPPTTSKEFSYHEYLYMHSLFAGFLDTINEPEHMIDIHILPSSQSQTNWRVPSFISVQTNNNPVYSYDPIHISQCQYIYATCNRLAASCRSFTGTVLQVHCSMLAININSPTIKQVTQPPTAACVCVVRLVCACCHRISGGATLTNVVLIPLKFTNLLYDL